jgi:hypothetical protein
LEKITAEKKNLFWSRIANYEVGSRTNANGQIKQKLEEIGGTLFFKIS